jgi:hypothetical protein
MFLGSTRSKNKKDSRNSGSFRPRGNCVCLVGPKHLQRLCRSVPFRNICKILVHTRCVEPNSRATVGDNPVDIRVDRGGETVQARELKIGEADSHVHFAFQAWTNRGHALSASIPDCSRMLVLTRASAEKSKTHRFSYPISTLCSNLRQPAATQHSGVLRAVIASPRVM